MKQMATYDLMETMRNTNEWLGASARAMASYPVWGLVPHPIFKTMSAWGRVTERSFARMVIKPAWDIRTVVGEDGRDHLVEESVEIARPFGDLLHFKVQNRAEKTRRILLCAPMSGHYSTLLRSTVASLLPDAEVWITDWHNARDIPVSEGKFDIEDYTQYIVDFMKHLGPDTHVVAVCQPVPLALAATALLAEQDPEAQPLTLTLIGGPVDPDAAPTEVTDFGRRVTMGQLEHLAIQRVGFKSAGVGRLVYPGLFQLAGFISMNMVNGHKVDIGAITDVAVKIVEGSKDDISAPGQCLAALDLLTGLPDEMKAQHLEDGAGHYGIFAGRSWRENIRPLVFDFMDHHTQHKSKTPKSAIKLAASQD